MNTVLLVPDYTLLAPFLGSLRNVEIVGLDPQKRNDAFSPWKATVTALKKEGIFDGHADAYLTEVLSILRPRLAEDGKVGILGISLGALFGVYATIREPIFSFCASISGSFWFPGWTQWLQKQKMPRTAYFFCSGEDEGRGRTDALKDSRSATDFTSSHLHGTYLTDPKGHMSYLKERTASCVTWIQSQL
ncbi:MAG: hypothetical protein WCQ66_05430 [Sphaerochaetaceae bacterium]|jgi:predicted alpha/beta superfamily hydrolase